MKRSKKHAISVYKTVLSPELTEELRQRCLEMDSVIKHQANTKAYQEGVKSGIIDESVKGRLMHRFESLAVESVAADLLGGIHVGKRVVSTSEHQRRKRDKDRSEADVMVGDIHIEAKKTNVNYGRHSAFDDRWNNHACSVKKKDLYPEAPTIYVIGQARWLSHHGIWEVALYGFFPLTQEVWDDSKPFKDTSTSYVPWEHVRDLKEIVPASADVKEL